MGAFFNPILNIITDIQPFTYIIVAIPFVIMGLMLVLGGDEGRQKVKKWFPAVIVGIVLMLGGIFAAQYFVSKWTF